MEKKTVVFVGGDKRQIYAAEALLGKCAEIYLVGFEKAENIHKLHKTTLSHIADKGDIYIFPVSGVKGRKVPAEYSYEELKLSDEDLSKLKHKTIFCGKADTLQSLSGELRIFDYLSREDFAVANALPTAEGAVQIAMENYEGTIFGLTCLVMGYGRIGKILSKMLKSLNAKVTVSARRKDHLRYIETDGNTPVLTEKILYPEQYDIIFNTIPKMLIDSKMLLKLNKNALIIDLASAPGGVDFSVASTLGIRTIRALSLPGRCSPKSAGDIISKTILDIYKEEYGVKS